MTIPPPPTWAPIDPGLAWTDLGPETKHERILCAAGRVFSTEGLDASMPTVAAAAGAGVASVYRQFPSKRDLLAALVARRLEQIGAAARAAAARDGDGWTALTEFLWAVVKGQSGDDFLGEAFRMVADHPSVIAVHDRTVTEFDQLLAAARAAGRLRPDASSDDLTLLFTATRAARQIGPGAHRRMLELLIDGLRAPGPTG